MVAGEVLCKLHKCGVISVILDRNESLPCPGHTLLGVGIETCTGLFLPPSLMTQTPTATTGSSRSHAPFLEPLVPRSHVPSPWTNSVQLTNVHISRGSVSSLNANALIISRPNPPASSSTARETKQNKSSLRIPSGAVNPFFPPKETCRLPGVTTF